MYFRILAASLVRRWRRKLLAVTSVALGITLVTALVAVALDVGDKVGRELSAYGANIDVDAAAGAVAASVAGGPAAAGADSSLLLDERDLPRLTNFFWAHNLLAFAPLLSTPVRLDDGGQAVLVGTWFAHRVDGLGGVAGRVTGIRGVAPWWRVAGRWPLDDARVGECLVGRRAAARLGLHAGESFAAHGERGTAQLQVTGILTTGGPEEDWIWAPLPTAQSAAGLLHRYTRLQVNALTAPETGVVARDPSTMTPAQLEILECTAYPTTIARSIERTLPGARAHAIREVTDTQGAVLGRVRLVVFALLVAGAAAAALGVLGAMAAAVLERRVEVGLLKALGASRGSILALFLGEACALGLVGGALGYVAGSAVASEIGRAIFHSPTAVSGVVLPLSLGSACCLSLIGSAFPIRRALRVDPIRVLHGA